MKFKIKMIAAALVITVAGSYAAFPAAAENLPEKGDKINGFTVSERRPFELLGAELITFEHDKTGARALFCINDDIDRSFQISFKTPAPDNTGITHIFEHAALGGSEKYPSRTLFLKLVNQTYNTYMNAATAQNVTSFLFSSLSEAQLLSLGGYYLDSVFNPMLYTDESIFDREAWRYELTSGGDDLTVSGTVYSEMRGASNITNDNFYNVRRTLFPGSSSANVSGGVPEDMLSLDNGDLIEYHKKYYHPSNSLTIVYGDVECRDVLKLLDGYFSEYEKSDISPDFDDFSETDSFTERSFDYPARAGSGAGLNSCVSYAVECKGADSGAAELAKLGMAVDVWAGAVESEVERTMPGALLSCNLDTDSPEPTVIFTASSPDSGIGERLKRIADDAARRIAEEGVSEDLLRSIALTARRARARALDYTLGESGLQAASMWAVSDDPDYFFDFIDASLALENITGNSIAETLKKYAVGARSAVVVTSPSAGLAESMEEELEKKLADAKAAMSDEEIDLLTEKTYEYHNPESDNDELDRRLLDEISVVDAKSLPEETRSYKISDETTDGVRYISADAEISEMGRGGVMLDASDIPAEDLNWLTFYVSLIGTAGTEKYSAGAFKTISGQYADCTVNITALSGGENGFTPYVIFSYDGFADNSDMIFDIAEQALLKTKLDDTAAIAELAARYRSSEAGITDSDGYELLLNHVQSSSDPKAAYSNALGLTLDSDMDSVLDTVETDMGAAVEKLKEIRRLLMNKRGAVVIYAGSEENAAENKDAAEKFFEKLPDAEKSPADYSSLMTKYESSALAMNSSVNCNGLFAPINKLGIDYNGAMEVAMSCITDKILLPALRDKLNAYSAQCKFTDSGLLAYSYHDPGIADTFNVYSSLGDMISGADITQDDVDRYILSVYSDYTKPGGELNDAYLAAVGFIQGVTRQTKLEHMREIKSATPESVKAMAGAFKMLYENGVMFTAGSADGIADNSSLYDNILNPHGYGTGEIKIIINSNALITPVPAYIENDRVMLPMRSVFEALGAQVEWDGETRTVTARKDGITITLTIDADTITVISSDGSVSQEALDSPAVIRSDRTMVPLRAVSEALGYNVDWNGDTQTVSIG